MPNVLDNVCSLLSKYYFLSLSSEVQISDQIDLAVVVEMLLHNVTADTFTTKKQKHSRYPVCLALYVTDHLCGVVSSFMSGSIVMSYFCWSCLT